MTKQNPRSIHKLLHPLQFLTGHGPWAKLLATSIRCRWIDVDLWGSRIPIFSLSLFFFSKSFHYWYGRIILHSTVWYGIHKELVEHDGWWASDERGGGWQPGHAPIQAFNAHLAIVLLLIVPSSLIYYITVCMLCRYQLKHVVSP